MRITNGILSRETISGYQNQLRALDDARTRASTGLRVSKPSDDPVAVGSIMTTESGLRALEQHRRNIETGQSRLAIEDSVLEQIGNALARGRELAIGQGSDTATAASRRNAQKEIDGLVDFVTDLANTQFGGMYVFGGNYADQQPFVAGATNPAKPPSGSLKIEIGTKLFVDTNHSAQEIFIDSDVVDSLRNLSTALGANDTPGILNSLTRIDAAFDETQELVGDLGARMSQLDVTGANLDSLEVTLSAFKAGLQDADLAKAITDLVARQGAIEAAMLANANILNITLTDYLR